MEENRKYQDTSHIVGVGTALLNHSSYGTHIYRVVIKDVCFTVGDSQQSLKSSWRQAYHLEGFLCLNPLQIQLQSLDSKPSL